jgi:hypothetical protein
MSLENGIAPILLPICHCEPRIIGAWQSRCGDTSAPILDGLPAQERVGHVIDDIPDIGGLACAGIGNCGYGPRCS